MDAWPRDTWQWANLGWLRDQKRDKQPFPFITPPNSINAEGEAWIDLHLGKVGEGWEHKKNIRIYRRNKNNVSHSAVGLQARLAGTPGQSQQHPRVFFFFYCYPLIRNNYPWHCQCGGPGPETWTIATETKAMWKLLKKQNFDTIRITPN